MLNLPSMLYETSATGRGTMASKQQQRRGRLRPEDEHKLQTYADKILDEVDATDVVEVLYKAQVFDRDDLEDVKEGRMRRERTRRLLDLLSRRGPWAFDHFVRALEKKGYEGLVRLLKKSDEADPKGVGSETVPGPRAREGNLLPGPRAREGNPLRKIEEGWAELDFRLTRLLAVNESGSEVLRKEFREFQEKFKALKNSSMEQLKKLAADNVLKNDKIRTLEHDLETARGQIEKLERTSVDTSSVIVEHGRRLEALEKEQTSRLQRLEQDMTDQGKFFRNFREEMLRALESYRNGTGS